MASEEVNTTLALSTVVEDSNSSSSSSEEEIQIALEDLKQIAEDAVRQYCIAKTCLERAKEYMDFCQNRYQSQLALDLLDRNYQKDCDVLGQKYKEERENLLKKMRL